MPVFLFCFVFFNVISATQKSPDMKIKYGNYFKLSTIFMVPMFRKGLLLVQ